MLWLDIIVVPLHYNEPLCGVNLVAAANQKDRHKDEDIAALDMFVYNKRD